MRCVSSHGDLMGLTLSSWSRWTALVPLTGQGPNIFLHARLLDEKAQIIPVPRLLSTDTGNHGERRADLAGHGTGGHGAYGARPSQPANANRD
jgi:hypothetical protein